ncbi:lysophospholipase [bacterium]|nr:lysophospholipase [bacterium]
MKTSIFTVIIAIATIFFGRIFLNEAKADTKTQSFSFEELKSAEKVDLPAPQYLEAGDKTNLAFREYLPKQTDATLIFFHGGGAHSAAGYQHIGNGLSNHFNIAVYAPDIRGHGNSEGDRGDAPSSKQVLDDIGVIIRHVRMKHAGKPLFLGGHSSGAGLILNYSSFPTKEKIQGYVFLSPHLGFRSKTENDKNPHPFAEVKTSLFIKNAMFGTDGNSKAVFFNYSKEALEKNPALITAITVNMSNALTPSSPGDQLKELDLPLASWIGAEDEVLDKDKVTSFINENYPKSFTKIVAKEKHLSILLTASPHIGAYIQSIIGEKVP